VLARAWVQSITIDEAESFLAFAHHPEPFHWNAATANHVLNSALMRLFSSILGPKHLVLRLPALIGAVLYVLSALWIVLSVAERKWVQIVWFAALVFNPFVMDYLVAARGYSLGLGLLMAGVVFLLRESPAWASACFALAFCANFSFGIVVDVFLALLFVWTRRAVAVVLPAVGIIAFFVGSILPHFPREAINSSNGTKLFSEMLGSVLKASLYEPNRYLLNPPLYDFATTYGYLVFWILSLAALAHLACLAVPRLRGKLDSQAVRVAWLFGGALLATLAAHRLVYRLFHVMMPVDRTAVFLAPLITLAIGAVAVLPSRTRHTLAAALALTSLYFVCCLRLTYFREWKYNAEVKQVFDILNYYNHQHGLRAVSANWRYVSALNYYRVEAGGDTFAEIGQAPLVRDDYPLPFQAYVVYAPWDQGFVERQGLKMVWVGPLSDVGVAIRPELDGPVSYPISR
jgi:hypothetical protein